MFTSRFLGVSTAALVISGAVTLATSTGSRGRNINSEANTAAQAELPGAAAQAGAALG